MLYVARIVFHFVALGVLTVFVVLLWTVDKDAAIQAGQSLKSDDIARAKRILDGTLLQKNSQTLNTLSLTERDLNVAANYLLRLYIDGAAQVELGQKKLICNTSLSLPPNSIGRFVNLRFRLDASSQHPTIKELIIGRLAIPEEIASWIIETAIASISHHDFHIPIGDHIKNIEVSDDVFEITYRSSPITLNGITTLFADSIPQELLRSYRNRLVEITGQPALKRYVPLSKLFEPLFQLARKRSETHDPVAENRALILVVSTYVHDKNLGTVDSSDQQSIEPRHLRVLLNGRVDSAQHFTASAVLAVSGDTRFADTVGLYKEITDSHFGSGFSFVDLASDRAGAEFGSLSIASNEDARKLQKRMAKNLKDRFYMPRVNDLPEKLDAKAFKEKFGAIDSPSYKRTIRKIEKRISNLTIHR